MRLNKLLWINVKRFRLREATERWLDFDDAQEEGDNIQKASPLSDRSVVILDTVTEIWHLFCSMFRYPMIKSFKNNQITLPFKG